MSQANILVEAANNETLKQEVLLSMKSFEEADCYFEFISKPYPNFGCYDNVIVKSANQTNVCIQHITDNILCCINLKIHPCESQPFVECFMVDHVRPRSKRDRLRFIRNLHPHCNATWDGLSCWPTTPAESMASIPCFAQFNGVQYDTSNNASRFCHLNSSWSPWSNYRSCQPMHLQEDEFLQGLWDTKEAATIYYVGYGISLVALSLALVVFLRFKDLRCLRNTIHTNLMVTYLLIDVTWILTATLQSNTNTAAVKVSCFLVILLTYLMATNFFWMLVEGLYLYMLVVKTFSIENVNFKIYVAIGWGIPAIVASAWAIAKGFAGNTLDEPFTQKGCPWQNKDYYDYVFSCPVMVVLLVNIFFLAKIMWVLITKLRASNTQESKQYWKAAKALLVLIPLLGVTYIIVIATPSNPVAEVVFIYIQATLLSIQGFMVAVLYCFLNGEVQNSLRSHFDRWRTRKSVSKTARQSTRHFSTRHNSCRSIDARDSCASHVTVTSVINSKDVKYLESSNQRTVRGHML